MFVTETRTLNGENYPPRTLYSLLTGVLRHMRAQNPSYPNFLDRRNPAFSALTTVLDNLFKTLHCSGVGAKATHTEGITSDEEDKLWETNVLNIDTPLGLLWCVFFYNGKCFCLRGGQEHRELKLSQLQRCRGPDKYLYSENSSKNRKGGLSEIRLEHKTVSTFANPEAGNRCHVFLLDLYLSKLPQEAFKKDIFYCRPNQSKPTDSTSPWFCAVPIGRNQLSKMVQTMCEEAGVLGHKTNHSLRVIISGASILFDAGVPVRIIQARTGHRSLDALRLYERITDKQNFQVSKTLSGQEDAFETDKHTESSCSKFTRQEGNDDEESCSKVTTTGMPTPHPTAQYNNCTVNMYSAPMPQPCYPPVHYYPPYYPPPQMYENEIEPMSSAYIPLPSIMYGDKGPMAPGNK